jgi:predicted dehydrogenase
MKFLIAGLGSIGRRHLWNLKALGEEDIILLRSHRSTLPDEELKDYPEETDIRSALEHKPDAVIVSNPTALHMQVAVPAAEAGCALFIEKPLAYRNDDLLPLEAALAQHHNKVLTAYQFRFNPGLQKIRELLTQNEIGRGLSFRCHWGEYLPNFHPWEDYRQGYAARKELGGGVVLTLSHPLDYLRWLFGDVRELYALVGKFSDLEVDVEDQAEAILNFENGVAGSLHLDYYRRPKRHDLEISGTQGILYWDYSTDQVSLTNSEGEVKTFPAPDGFERNQMYLDEMRHFIEVVKGKVEPCCSYTDGKKALQLAWGILQSGRYNQRVIFD